MIALALSLFGSITFADDGDQGSGNNTTCTVNCPPPPCTVDCGSGLTYQADETETSGGTEVVDTAWSTIEFAADYILF